MARIRSIHPGLFTDEAFVALSSDAQVFLMGIWTEADDQGMFEWKPTTLRMRLRPTKDGPVDGLLDEMLAANAIKKHEINGRHYGAIRNFRKYQRPKSPNAIHPITDEIRIYVGLSQPVSEIPSGEVVQFPQIGEPFPQNGEIAPQMEEGGDNRRGKKEAYAFEGKVVKLRKTGFDAWVKAFPRLDLLGELTARDAYLAGPRATDADRANWFASTSQHLANRNMTAGAKQQAMKPDGTPRPTHLDGIL